MGQTPLSLFLFIMADFTKFFPVLMKHEGGSKLTNIDKDAGGWTKWGITLATWISKGFDKDKDGDIDLEDLKQSDINDAMRIAKPFYWDKVYGDQINCQAIAEFLCDWAYNSGVGKAVKKVQQLLPSDIKSDGDMGPKTLAAINAKDPKVLFDKLKASRESFYRAIVKANPDQEKFLKGWLNRNNSFTFKC